MNDRQMAIDAYLSDRSRENRDALIAAHMYLCNAQHASLGGRPAIRRLGASRSDRADKGNKFFVVERTTPFEAYVWIVIVGELMHYIRDCEHAIRIPRWLRSIDRRYVAAWEAIARNNTPSRPHYNSHARLT